MSVRLYGCCCCCSHFLSFVSVQLKLNENAKSLAHIHTRSRTINIEFGVGVEVEFIESGVDVGNEWRESLLMTSKRKHSASQRIETWRRAKKKTQHQGKNENVEKMELFITNNRICNKRYKIVINTKC